MSETYRRYLCERWKWASKGVGGVCSVVSFVVGALLAILIWFWSDWMHLHVSERMSTFVTGLIPLLAGGSVFGIRWFVSPFYVLRKQQLAHRNEIEDQKELTQKAEARILELERVGLKGRIRYAAYLKDANGRDGIAVALQITNTGEPTIVDGWGLTFELDGSKVALPATHFLDGKCEIPYKDGKVVGIKLSDMLYEKVGNNPIVKGGRISGFLVFRTKDISYERLIAARPRITVLFRDALGREHTAEQGGQGIAAPFHEPGLDDAFAPILIAQVKEAEAGQKLYYAVVEKIEKGSRPIMALLELGVADELDTNADVVNFCSQLVVDKHGDPFEHLRIMYPPEVWREFLKEARRKNLKFPDSPSEVEYMNERLREHEAKMKMQEGKN